MGRRPCCSKEELNKGAWTTKEDQILRDYIKIHGKGKWRNLPKKAGLKRCGKSCRLRWLNYLRPDIKRGNITQDEEDLIIRLHKLLGNRWSLIAGRLPGRTDNEIKNYWNTKFGKKGQNYVPNSSSTSSQSKEKQNARMEQPTTESCVVTSPDTQQSLLQLHTMKMKEKDLVDDGRYDPPSDFMMDLEMDEKFLSDLLNTDFGQMFENDDGNPNDFSYLSSSPNQTLFFSGEMVAQDSNLNHGCPFFD